MKRAGVILLAGWLAATAGPAAEPEPVSVEIAGAAVDRGGLLPADLAWLDRPDFRWRHLQTEHFLIHHDQRMFAAKVARLGEQFHAAIAADLPGLQDRIAPARSHIFIFRNARDWQAVVAGTAGLDDWTASFVRGPVMYLQQTGTAAADRMATLAHEMTHLVLTRFVPVRLPLWLNEGLAEYYGEFAYRDAKGLGQSPVNAFRPLKNPLPLAELLAATGYPADAAEVRRFYATSKYLAGFLLLRQPKEKWPVFFARAAAGESATAALLETYGWPGLAGLEKDFLAFAR